MTSPASPAAPAPSPGPVTRAADRTPGPTHGCVRCGTPIPVHESMCEACNPLGLKTPAPSQAHGTVFIGILVAVLGMAVVARLLVAGVGPFPSSVAAVAPDPGGLRVTVTVTNQGHSAGATTCRIDDPSRGGISPAAAFVQSPRVEPGQTVTFDVVVAGFGTLPIELLADCES